MRGGIASKTLTLEFRTNGRAGAISVIKMRRSKWCGPRSDRSVVLETAIISVISVKIVRRDRWSDISKFFQSLQLDDSKNKVFGANFCQPSTIRFDIYIYIRIESTIRINRHVPLPFLDSLVDERKKRRRGEKKNMEAEAAPFAACPFDTRTLNDKCLARFACHSRMHSRCTRVHLLDEIYAVKVWNR